MLPRRSPSRGAVTVVGSNPFATFTAASGEVNDLTMNNLSTPQFVLTDAGHHR